MADAYTINTNPHFRNTVDACAEYIEMSDSASERALNTLAHFAALRRAMPEGAKLARIPFYGEKVEGAPKGKEYPTKSRIDRAITYGTKVADDLERFDSKVQTPAEFRQEFERLGWKRLDDALAAYKGGNRSTDRVKAAVNAIGKVESDEVPALIAALAESDPTLCTAIAEFVASEAFGRMADAGEQAAA